ncbi:MAG: lamin tail domain-containing protein, partial [Bacteroidota bacterium]
YVFVVDFNAFNSISNFVVFIVGDNRILSTGNSSPITFTLAYNISTEPFNILIRDTNDNDCKSEEVEVTLEDCSPCEINNLSVQNAACQNLDYVFEVAFEDNKSSGSFEVINIDDNSVLASGIASPIEVILINNSSIVPVTIAVRDANDNTCQSESVEVVPEDCVASCMQADARINEFHYDDINADTLEFVEIFIPNPQPSDLSEYRIDLYNGNNGTSYEDITLDITTTTSDANGSYYVWEIEGIQNGAPDGIALSGSCGLIEFISYEGTFTGTEGVANGVESVDIGVAENSNTPELSSIQLIDNEWILTSAFNTKGAENELPPCEITDATIQNAACQGEDYVFEVSFDASNGSGNFEVFDVTNNMVLASGSASPIEVTLIGNTSNTPFIIIVRYANDNTCASEEVEVMPEDCTPPCEITNITVQNGGCQDANYVFEVTFNASNSSSNFEVINSVDNSILATGDASPITISLVGNTSTEAFNILVRDANDNTCASEAVEVIPEDCTPLICANVGDLVITEIQKDPAAVADTLGEWFEIYNATNIDIDLKGYVIRDAGSDNHEIITSVIIPANEYIVLARNEDSIVNGGVNVAYQYGRDIILSNTSDEVIIECNGVVIDSVGYDNGATFPDQAGASISLNPENLNASDNDNGANWCEASSAYGDGDLGTPGTANDPCPACMISNLSANDLMCQGADFVFEVSFDAENSSDNFEVIRVDDNRILASGNSASISVIIAENTDTTSFEIFVRDAEDNECVSDTIRIQPLDCTPLVCANVGDLVITEILPDPTAVDDADGEWFEVYNATNAEIDLKGYVIRDAGSNNHEIATNAIVPANGYIVLARNADFATNGGVNAAYEYGGDITLVNSSDEVILECNGIVIDSVGYDNGLTFPNTAGASISLNPNNLNAIDNDNGLNWCEASSAYNASDLGTPGVANDACPDCMISGIALENQDCQGADFVFEVAFEANVRGTFEVVKVEDGNVLASGNTSPILVTLAANTDTSSFEIFVRNINETDCASESIIVRPFDCTPPDCVNPGDLVITEIMQNPDAVTDEFGEWFEIYNTTSDTVNLKGYVIRDADGERHKIASDVFIDSLGYVVLARNADFFTNGRYFADYEYGNDIVLTNTADEIIIECDGIVIDSVGYDEDFFPDPTGASMNLDPNKIDAIENDNPESWCEGRRAYGLGDLGTPGRRNSVCPPCSITMLEIENRRCTEEGFVFEVDFVSTSSSGNFEVVRVDNDSILAVGNGSPITVTIPENQDTTSFEILIRDLQDERCASATILVMPLDCIPFNCAAQGDLVITEIQKNPAAVADTLGEWFELYNATNEAINLNGYTIRDNG